MVTLTYQKLQDQIASALRRTDLTSQIQEFIDRAERRLSRELAPRGFETYVGSTMTAGSAGAIIDQPADFLSDISFVILANAQYPTATGTGTVRSFVQRKSYSFVRAYWPDQTALGTPRYWCDMGTNQFLVGPSPIAAFAFELGYYGRLASLSASNATNYLTQYAPELLFYASLLESAPYLADDPRIQVWTTMYDRLALSFGAMEKRFETAEQDTPKKEAAPP